MKLQFLDYIPIASWINTYRHGKRLSKLENKVNDLSSALYNNKKHRRIGRIIGTAIPGFGNLGLGIYDLIKSFDKDKNTKKAILNYPV